MSKKYGSVTQGRTAEQLENYKAKSAALGKKKDAKFVKQLHAIKEHVSGGKKSGGFNDPYWYSK